MKAKELEELGVEGPLEENWKLKEELEHKVVFIRVKAKKLKAQLEQQIVNFLSHS